MRNLKGRREDEVFEHLIVLAMTSLMDTGNPDNLHSCLDSNRIASEW
jgi:hypothetical protein